MPERIIKMIEYLLSSDGSADINDIAAVVGVGERSIRRYISQANESLNGLAEIVKLPSGHLALSIHDDGAFRSVLHRAQHATLATDSPRERVSYLISDLLSRADWVTLDTLADILCVSRRTVSNDLRDVERMLSRYNLGLESRPYRGIRAIGREYDKRLCLANMVFQRVLDSQDEAVGDISIASVQRCVDRALDGSRISFSSINYHNLLAHIAIALIRIRANTFVPFHQDILEGVRTSHAYDVALRIGEELSCTFDVVLPDEEIAYISMHLAGKETLLMGGTPSASLGGDARGLTISDESWNLVSEMLEAVWAIYRIDYRKDLELRMNLARHVGPLVIRLQHHMVAENPLLDDIRAHFPLAWSMAVDASHVLEDRYGAELAPAETGYLALAFALAIERSSGVAPKKNVLIVCASGAGTARLLEYRCRREFDAYIDTITTCDAINVASMDFSNIDCVFTTVPLPIEVPVPVREVSAFFDDSDAAAVADLFHRHDHSEGLIRYFPEELFFAHMPWADRETALGALIGAATARYGLGPEFGDLVRERERIAPTAFGKSVALPHPARSIGGSPFVAVGLLDEPIAWGAHEVRAIFLISFSDDPDLDAGEFNEGIAALLSSEIAISQLLEAQSYDILRALLGGMGDASTSGISAQGPR